MPWKDLGLGGRMETADTTKQPATAWRSLPQGRAGHGTRQQAKQRTTPRHRPAQEPKYSQCHDSLGTVFFQPIVGPRSNIQDFAAGSTISMSRA